MFNPAISSKKLNPILGSEPSTAITKVKELKDVDLCKTVCDDLPVIAYLFKNYQHGTENDQSKFSIDLIKSTWPGNVPAGQVIIAEQCALLLKDKQPIISELLSHKVAQSTVDSPLTEAHFLTKFPKKKVKQKSDPSLLGSPNDHGKSPKAK
jgi:hypothetical protein